MAPGDGGREAYTAIAWGVGLSHERSDIAGAEGFHSLEGNMCGTAMRGADALPGSKATSRANAPGDTTNPQKPIEADPNTLILLPLSDHNRTCPDLLLDRPGRE